MPEPSPPPEEDAAQTGNFTPESASYSVPGRVYTSPEDGIAVSKTKLESLKELADDDRLDAPIWNLNRVFGTIGGGLFFTSLGTMPTFDQMSAFWKPVSVMSLGVGLLFAAYCFFQESRQYGKRDTYRKKMVGKIDAIINDLERMKRTHESQGSAPQG